MRIWVLLSVCLLSGITVKATTQDELLDVIRLVESTGGKNLEGDYLKSYPYDKGFRAIGPYQMWRCYVDDVNMVLRDKLHSKVRYTYNDRWDETKSREMVRIYLWYWSRQAGTDKVEDVCLIHHFGPKGYKHKDRSYWTRKICPALKVVQERR